MLLGLWEQVMKHAFTSNTHSPSPGHLLPPRPSPVSSAVPVTSQMAQTEAPVATPSMEVTVVAGLLLSVVVRVLSEVVRVPWLVVVMVVFLLVVVMVAWVLVPVLAGQLEGIVLLLFYKFKIMGYFCQRILEYETNPKLKIFLVTKLFIQLT